MSSKDDYADRFHKYMGDFPHHWDEFPIRVARCNHCDGLTLNPQDNLCACGNELYPVTRLMLPGLTYYPGHSGGDEPKDKDEGPRNVILNYIPYRNDDGKQEGK
jgi:hypothetical protein